MKFVSIALTLLASVPAASAGEPASAYSGQEAREIKALAADEVAGLLAGKGLGYGKSAELNRYPGPAHVLELTTQLQLNEDQVTSTRAIHAGMEEHAKRVGAQLVSAEAALEQLFRSRAADQQNLKAALELIGKLEAELRGVHLLAHIQQHGVLSQEQIARYVHLRGYHGQHGASGHGH